MDCSKCHSWNRTEWDWCPHCGNKNPSTGKEARCPACDKKVLKTGVKNHIRGKAAAELLKDGAGAHVKIYKKV